MVESQSQLGMQIGLGAVNIVSAKINLRTLNQGHSMFTAILDNNTNIYGGVFDVMNSVYLSAGGVIVFRGTIDSIKRKLSHDAQWNYSDTMRIAGRDMSFDLSNFKTTRSFYIPIKAMEIAKLAVADTACDISIGSPTALDPLINYTYSDKFLLDIVTQMLELGGYEGYISTLKSLVYFKVGSMSTGITLNTTNILDVDYTEKDGIDIRNNIKVYGQVNLWDPEVLDYWTNDAAFFATNWIAVLGTKALVAGGVVGTHHVKLAPQNIGGGNAHLVAVMTFPTTIRVGDKGQYQKLAFWVYQHPEPWIDSDHYRVLLYTNPTNYYMTDLKPTGPWWKLWGGWRYVELPIGLSAMDNVGSSDPTWTAVGSPDWSNIIAVGFDQLWHTLDVGRSFDIDAMFIGKKRCHGESICIGAYHNRDHTVETDAANNAECQLIANDLANKMCNPVTNLQVVCPLSTFIVGGVWKGLPGWAVTVSLPGIVGNYRIVDMTLDVEPFKNLKDGYDAIATVNLSPIATSANPDVLATVLSPKLTSMMKRYMKRR